MKIKKIKVENFGKLHSLELDLSESLNMICEANGYGKTTLSNFIAVMFFGFDGERKKAIVDNQRKRYAPWQGGVYGGSITFEHDGKEYLLERTFGAKDAKEDTFDLYDATTMLKSDDFSENIGEEILSIDRDSFVRTAFIGQQDMMTAATSSINAKMGDLSSELADLADYEDVEATLSSTITQMSPTRKTGEIYKLNEEIAHLRAEIQKENAKRLSLEILEEQQAELKEKKNSLEEERRALQTRINEISKKKDEYNKLAVVQQNYANAKRELDESIERVREDRSFFPGEIPTVEAIDDMVALNSNLVSQKSLETGTALTEEEEKRLIELGQMFPNRIPTSEEVSKATDLANEIKTLKEQVLRNKPSDEDDSKYETLKNKFSYADSATVKSDIDSALNLINSRDNHTESRNDVSKQLGTKLQSLVDLQSETLKCKNTVAEQEALYNKTKASLEVENSAVRSGRISLAILIVGLVIAILGGAGFALKLPNYVCLGLIAIGIVLAVVGIIKKSKSKPTNSVSAEAVESIRRMLEDSKESLSDKVSRENILKGEISELESKFKTFEELVRGDEDKLSIIAKAFNISDDKLNVGAIYELQSDFNRYKELDVKKKTYAESGVEEGLDSRMNELAAFLESIMNVGGNEDLISIVTNLTHLISELRRLSSLKEKQEKVSGELLTYKAKLIDFFQKYEFDVAADRFDFQKELIQIGNARAKLYDDVAVVNVKDANLKQIQASDEYSDALKADALKKEIDAEPIEALNVKSEEMQLSIDDVQKLINEKALQINEVQDELDEIENSKIECDELVAKQSDLSHRLQILKRTSALLSEAKNSLTTKYMAPFRDAFFKYYDMIDAEGDKEYVIDAKLNIAVKEFGRSREVAFLSSGYQDLVNLCSRMAMLDCMYQGEKPLIIMDDPFVNLDEEKYQKAMNFLEDASNDYQILYFSCRG